MMNYVMCKLYLILSNAILQCIKRIIHCDQERLFPGMKEWLRIRKSVKVIINYISNLKEKKPYDHNNRRVKGIWKKFSNHF